MWKIPLLTNGFLTCGVRKMKNYPLRGRNNKNIDSRRHSKSSNSKNVRHKREIENCTTVEELERKLKYHKLLTKNTVLIVLCEKLIKEKNQ